MSPDTNNPVRYFGQQVRKARLSHGWSLHEFGEQVIYHPAALSRIENGKRPPTATLAKACDRVFPERGGWFHEFFEESRGWMALPAWLRDWTSHEQSARYLRDWCPSIVTGLLQTEDYARGASATTPMVTDDEVSARVAARMARQQRALLRDDPPAAWFLLDYFALVRGIGTPEVMAGQITDATNWPGIPVASWPEAVPGMPFSPPSGRGTPRLVNTDGTGRCPSCGHAVSLRLDGKTIAHNISTGTGQHCPGSGEPPAKDAPLASWLPIKEKLTPHGLRHSHKPWMAEDGIPEILAEQRLGHQVPGMRGLYAHASERMRDDLTKALQVRWEESLRQRATLAPHSPVPLLASLLAQANAGAPGSTGSRDSSQIPPSKAKAPIHNVG